MRGVLDQELVDGALDTMTSLRPPRIARLVTSTADVRSTITHLTQVWGGSRTPLVPMRDHEIDPAYLDRLASAAVDGIDVDAQDPEPAVPEWLRGHVAHEVPAIELVSASQSLRQSHPQSQVIAVPVVDDDDPWQLIYECVLGRLPKRPEPSLYPHYLTSGTPDTFAPLHLVQSDVVGSLADLITRTIGPDLYPARLSDIALAGGEQPDASLILRSTIPNSHEQRRAAGPNVLVVLGEEPFLDVTLLWNLRCARPVGAGALPLGIPHKQFDAAAMATLARPGAITPFGLAGGQVHVTTVSGDLAQLRATIGDNKLFRATDWRHLLKFGPAPGRPRSQVVTWEAGRASVVALAGSDRDALRSPNRRLEHMPLMLDVRIRDEALPCGQTMRGYFPISGPWFRGGQAQVPVSTSSGAVSVRWPTRWTCLEAAARDRGLRVSESGPGTAAMSLLRSLGGLGGVSRLGHPGLIDLLVRMSETEGMKYYKRRYRELLDDVSERLSPPDLEQIGDIHDPRVIGVAPPDAQRTATFEEFRSVLGGSQAATSNWIAWAVDCRVLVRGTGVRCHSCKAAFWVPMAAAAPPIVCPGCGLSIEDPFPARGMNFAYRIGEVLRRVLENDALGHLLVAHHLSARLRGPGLVGVHPGVDIDQDGRRIGEADVVLLLANGDIVPVEFKETPAGLREEQLDRFATLERVLKAPWSVIALRTASRDIPEDVVATTRRGVTPRMVLSMDHLLGGSRPLALGEDPFEWRVVDEHEAQGRDDRFVQSVGKWNEASAPDPIRDWLIPDR